MCVCVCVVVTLYSMLSVMHGVRVALRVALPAGRQPLPPAADAVPAALPHQHCRDLPEGVQHQGPAVDTLS